MHRSGAAMAWNVFKFCTALRGLGSIMILLVLGVVGVTYYAVVLTNYGPALYSGGLDSVTALAVLLLFHCLVSFSGSSLYEGIFEFYIFCKLKGFVSGALGFRFGLANRRSCLVIFGKFYY